VVHVTRETAFIDGRESSCVLCCFPRQLLIVAETSRSQWTVQRSWKAKEVFVFAVGAFSCLQDFSSIVSFRFLRFGWVLVEVGKLTINCMINCFKNLTIIKFRMFFIKIPSLRKHSKVNDSISARYITRKQHCLFLRGLPTFQFV